MDGHGDRQQRNAKQRFASETSKCPVGSKCQLMYTTGSKVALATNIEKQPWALASAVTGRLWIP